MFWNIKKYKYQFIIIEIYVNLFLTGTHQKVLLKDFHAKGMNSYLLVFFFVYFINYSQFEKLKRC